MLVVDATLCSYGLKNDVIEVTYLGTPGKMGGENLCYNSIVIHSELT
jgi:hypothetical protein